MKLGDIARIHTNMSWADFWINPEGGNIGCVSEDAEKFNQDHIGVMFTADAILKNGVNPRRLAVWFDSIQRISGHPPHSVVKKTPAGPVITPALLRKLRIPTGAVPNETHTS